MANRIDKAASWLGNPRAEKNAGKQSMALTTGTATSDSENGFVNVIVGDTTITENNDGQSVIIPTSVKVLEGDTVIITANGNDTIKTPIVSDVIGGGDRTQADINAAEERASAMAAAAANAASVAQQAANTASTIASEASDVANATSQYFSHDTNGVHVMTVPDSPSEGPNLVANSEGILLRDDAWVLSQHTPSGFSVYERGHVNPAATFGQTTVIGEKNSSAQIVMDSDSIDMSYADSNIMHVGISQGTDGQQKVNTSFHAASVGDSTFADSGGTANGKLSHADSMGTCALGSVYSHADAGGETNGSYTHADSGGSGHGSYSHADSGGDTTGEHSHADSGGAAKGTYSHAQCSGTAEGYNSFASGSGTLITTSSGTALGKYNDTDDALFAIGCGTSDTDRKDAIVVKDDGSLTVSGTLTASKYGSINSASTIHATGDITSEGKILDKVSKGYPIKGAAISEGNCTYVKTGHIVQISIWAKLAFALNTYSTSNGCWTGLPKPAHVGTIGPFKIDGTTGTCFVQVDSNGALSVVSRETSIAANGVFTGSAIYISSE